MKHRDFKPAKLSSRHHTFTLEDGRTATFRIPTGALLRPMYDALQLIPDTGTVPKTVRDALIIEGAGTVIGYLWADTAMSLDTNWRHMRTFAEFGESVVEELFTGCAAIEAKEAIYKGKGDKKQLLKPEVIGKDAYAPWALMDLLNCLSGLTKVLNSTLPTEKEVAENANFT